MSFNIYVSVSTVPKASTRVYVSSMNVCVIPWCLHFNMRFEYYTSY